MSKYIHPVRRTVWVCGACGKHGPTRETVGDESCFIWGVEVWTGSLRLDTRGLVWEEIDGNAHTACDCFCGQNPFSERTDFRSDGDALVFVETATRAALAARK